MSAHTELRSPVAAERQAYYAAMRPLHLSPLWEQLHALVPPQPNTPCLAAHWRYEALRPHLMRSGTIISAAEAVRRVLVLENPGAARLGQRHAVALRRTAVDPARRSGARASAHAIGAAFRGRGPWRLHRGQRRAHDDGAGRLHHHAELDLARPRQRGRGPGGVARRPRHPAGALSRRRLRRERTVGAADADAPRGPQPGALRCQHGAAARSVTARRDVADLQLSVCALARGAGAIASRRLRSMRGTASSWPT